MSRRGQLRYPAPAGRLPTVPGGALAVAQARNLSTQPSCDPTCPQGTPRQSLLRQPARPSGAASQIQAPRANIGSQLPTRAIQIPRSQLLQPRMALPPSGLPGIPSRTLALAPRAPGTAAGISQGARTPGAIPRTALLAVPKVSAGTIPKRSLLVVPKVSAGAIPRVTTAATPRVVTGAIPRAPTGAIPRAPTGTIPRAPTGAIPRTTMGAVPRATTATTPRTITGAIPRTTTGAIPRTTTGAIPRTTTGAIPRTTGAIPRTTTGAIPKATRMVAPTTQEPSFRPTTYQRRTPLGATRSISSIPSKTGLAKTAIQSVEVKRTPSGAQKVTKEVTKIAPAPKGLPKGTYALPSIAPGERSVIQTETPVDAASPYAGKKQSSRSQIPPRGPLGDPLPKSRLAKAVEMELEKVAKKSPDKTVTAAGTRVTMVPPPIIMINDVPIQQSSQVITEKTVEKSPGIEKISRTLVGIEQLSPCTARRMELQMQELMASPPPHPTAPPKETISVRSIVSVSPTGQRETDTVVTVERTEPAENYGITPEEVQRMVSEENQDIKKSLKWKPIELLASTHTSFAIKRKEHDYQLTEDAVLDRQQAVVLPEPQPDEAPNDELQPELMATIMHTEEKGMDMVSEPTTIYSYLFPDATEIGPDVIEVSSAAPAPLHDVAVPSQTLPNTFYNNSVNPELERIIMETDGQGKKPSAAGFSDYQETKMRRTDPTGTADHATAITANIKKKHHKKRASKIKPVQPIDQEEPPWGEERRQERQQEQQRPIEKTLLDLVGASPSRVTGSELPVDSFAVGLSNAEAVDYVLHVEPPVYRSKVQLRGSCQPSWFPGYYVAFPEIPDIITVVKYPTIALTAAWRNTQPKGFPDDSLIVI